MKKALSANSTLENEKKNLFKDSVEALDKWANSEEAKNAEPEHISAKEEQLRLQMAELLL